MGSVETKSHTKTTVLTCDWRGCKKKASVTTHDSSSQHHEAAKMCGVYDTFEYDVPTDEVDTSRLPTVGVSVSISMNVVLCKNHLRLLLRRMLGVDK